MSLVDEYELLDFCVIGHVAIVVYATRLVASPTHEPSATGDKKQLKAILGALVVHVALDKSYEPVSGDLLSFEILTHVEVPHIPSVHGSIISNESAMSLTLILLQEHGSSLRIQS